MHDRTDDEKPHGGRVSPTAQAVGFVGTLPAVVFGAAAGGFAGAFSGLVLWGLAWILYNRVYTRGVGPRRVEPAPRRERDRRRGRKRRAAAPIDLASHRELFDQLRMSPCDTCGTATLLGTCIPCTTAKQRQDPRREPGGEPEDA